MTSAALLACLLDLAGGAVLPGPAEGAAEFRYADLSCSLTPSVVRPSGAAELTVRLTLRAGATWHEAPLAPSRVGITPAAGWTADASDIVLPPAETPRSPRQFTVRLRAAEELTGYEALEIRMRCGVRVERPAAGEDAGGPGEDERSDDKRAGEPAPAQVVFEQATLTVELPTALPAAALPAASGEDQDLEDEGKDGPGPAAAIVPLPRPADPSEDERGSPVVPALVFALATALVFVGLAAWFRRKRRDGDPG